MEPDQDVVKKAGRQDLARLCQGQLLEEITRICAHAPNELRLPRRSDPKTRMWEVNWTFEAGVPVLSAAHEG